jgi:glycosidase
LDPGRELYWLAECEEIAYHEVFDTSYAWKFLHKMEAVWRKESGLDGLDEVLQYYATMFPPDATRALFTTNHDENSHSGSEYERMGDAARAFSVLCCTWNGIPLIYSGQELPNFRRLRFFEKDCIEWKEGSEGNDSAAWAATCELHTFYKILLGLRARNPALRSGDPAATTHRLHISTGDRCWAFLRRNGDQEVLVLLNFSAAPLTVASAELLVPGIFGDVFTGMTYDLGAGPGIDLQAWGYAVMEKKQGRLL